MSAPQFGQLPLLFVNIESMAAPEVFLWQRPDL
jgi:hypothetical protein